MKHLVLGLFLGLDLALITACAGFHDVPPTYDKAFREFALAAPQGVYTLARFHGSNGQDLPYRLLMPVGYDATKAYPLIVWLHGSGEMGTNGNPLGNGTEIFAKPENLQKYPAIVLVPQCPTTDRWTNMGASMAPGQVHMSPTPTPTAKTTFELVTQVRLSLSVDPKRVAAVGLSVGGFGVYDFISRRQDLFTIGLPLSGGGDTSQAPHLIHLPIWDFHGDRDLVVGVAHSRVMIAAIRAAGGAAKYTEIPGGQHGPWAPIVAEPQVLDWLFTPR